jgi:hypothetical protein
VQRALVPVRWQLLEGRVAACWVLAGLQAQAWLLLLLLVHGQVA